VEAHGGSITAKSDGRGRGATFTVRFPVTSEVPARTSPQRPDSVTAVLHGVRALVVDDEAAARDLLRAMVESRGAEVSAVGSAGEALLALQLGVFDVLIADIGMPERDGFWLIHAVRESSHPQQDIPAIAVTAYASLRERELALDAGYNVHFAKPVDADQLVLAIASALPPDRRAGISV